MRGLVCGLLLLIGRFSCQARWLGEADALQCRLVPYIYLHGSMRGIGGCVGDRRLMVWVDLAACHVHGSWKAFTAMCFCT